jgi:hypothetical protein
MILIDDKLAQEESTFALHISFFDEDGVPVTPDAGLAWTLTDAAGATINSRTAVAITPAETVTVVLTGNDLAIQAGETAAKVLRRVLIAGTYNSTLGSNLAISEEIRFVLENTLVT